MELDEIMQATRTTLRRALRDDVDELLWTMSLPLENGGSYDCRVPSFSKLLQRMCQVSPSMRVLLRELWQREPSTPMAPLNLCVCGDEIVPGNVLRLDHARKLFLLFLAIKELGPTILKSTDAWFPIFAIRSTVLNKKFKGGISQCVRLLLRRIFFEEKIGSVGVVVSLDDDQSTRVALHFRVSNLIFDGDAQKQVFVGKGAKGKVPCLCCLNVVHEDESIPSPEFVSLTCTDASKLQFATSEDLYEKADILSRSAPPVMGATRFKRFETAVGLNYVPEALLWDVDLRREIRIAEAITFDSMHVLLANGMACDEIELLFGTIMDKATMGRRVVTWDHLRTFVDADFCFCHCLSYSGRPSRILSPAREERFKRDGTLSLGASEVLLMLPLITYFLVLTLAPFGMAPLAIASFKALGCVVALTQAGKIGRADADDLARAIRVHGDIFSRRVWVFEQNEASLAPPHSNPTKARRVDYGRVRRGTREQHCEARC